LGNKQEVDKSPTLRVRSEKWSNRPKHGPIFAFYRKVTSDNLNPASNLNRK